MNAGTQLARGSTRVSPALVSPGLLGLAGTARRVPAAGTQARRRRQERAAYAGFKRQPASSANLVVIGGGSAGPVTATTAAAVKAKGDRWWKRHRLGGDCPEHRLRVPSVRR